MPATARLRLPDGREVAVSPGDLLGRTPAAAVCLDDPRIAEAHALFSLRHGELYLISLRRPLTAGARTTGAVALRPGLVVALADALPLTVVSVDGPTDRLALRAAGQPMRLLSQHASIVGHPPRVLAKLDLDAHAVLWSLGADWRLRVRGQPLVAVTAGHRFEAAGVAFTLVAVPATPRDAAVEPGRGALRLVMLPDEIELHRRGGEAATITGTGARILGELLACQAPTAWELLARAVWPDSPEVTALRHRWDVALGRLRARLRDEGVRELLRADGAGQVMLALDDGDEVDDRTT